jgi:hypothetical protein
MGQVNQPSDVNSEIRELKRQVAELTKRVGLSSAVISRGGLRIINEGEFTVLNASDIEAFKVGQVEFGEGSSFGMRVNYEDGTRGIVFGGSSGQQVFALCDETGAYLVTNDAASGVGIARPYLNIPMYPSSGTSVGTGGPFWPQFTNTSYQEVFHGITSLWHPRIRVGVNTSASSGTVEWELRIDGTAIGSGSGDNFGTFNVTGWGTTILPGNQRSVQLWCRNTTGTASRVTIDYCYGLESG